MDRETFTFFHGIVLGVVFVLAFAGGIVGLNGLGQPAADRGVDLSRTRIGSSVMALVAWLMVITGTWIAYPWYRAPVPTSPRSILLADPATAGWHTIGMEWKEHVAWLAPILATAVVFVVFYYGAQLARERLMRRTATWVFVFAFGAAVVAGSVGVVLSNIAPFA